ncbi:GtrA family protein [Acinetobacter modestus]|uniref:GtrA family protein n=1 Tax=Acinetobacter modestus TaxID=1776740 RepID=UPI0030158F34
MQAHILQFLRFGMVGLIAALIHYVVVTLLIQPQYQVSLKYANFFAFLTAFWISYFGHRIFTFRVTYLQHRQTLKIFIVVATLGFLFNESILLISHHYLHFQVSLLVIASICITSIFTFLLNRYFAFQ